MRVIIWRLGQFVYIGGGGEGVIQETESLNFLSLEPRSWHLCNGPVIIIWTIHLQTHLQLLLQIEPHINTFIWDNVGEKYHLITRQ